MNNKTIQDVVIVVDTGLTGIIFDSRTWTPSEIKNLKSVEFQVGGRYFKVSNQERFSVERYMLPWWNGHNDDMPTVMVVGSCILDGGVFEIDVINKLIHFL